MSPIGSEYFGVGQTGVLGFDQLLDAFEDMDYEQLQGWLSELQSTHRLFEINPETYYTTVEPPEYRRG